MPFDVLGDGARSWVGKALQEGMISDFQQRGYQAAAGQGAADYVVSGDVQLVGDQMRISGDISSSSDSKPVGRFHCDGTVRDLFSIEDSLSSKADRLMTPTPLISAAAGKLALVGPSLPSLPRYFDGNIATTLQIKDQFTDQAYRYNYQPTQFYYGYYGYGWYPFFGYRYSSWRGVGAWFSGSPVAPVSGW
jgi:TolB-like protein